MSIAIVTGGAGAIGAAICVRLAERGDRVLCADVDAAAGERAFAEVVPELRERIESLTLDVTDERAWEAALERVEARGGAPTTLVNCAYASKLGSIDRLDHEAWRAAFDVTLHGAALGVRVIGNAMAARGAGAIVNIASVVAHGGAPVNAAYATAKSAVLGMTRTAAARLGRKGVRVNAVSPGWVDTPAVEGLFRAQARGERDPAAVRAEFERGIPLQRLARPEDIADAVDFLSGARSSYVNGVELVVDGGLRVA